MNVKLVGHKQSWTFQTGFNRHRSGTLDAIQQGRVAIPADGEENTAAIVLQSEAGNYAREVHSIRPKYKDRGDAIDVW